MTIKDLEQLNLTDEEWDEAILPFLKDLQIRLSSKASDYVLHGHKLLGIAHTPERLMLTLDLRTLRGVRDAYRRAARKKK